MPGTQPRAPGQPEIWITTAATARVGGRRADYDPIDVRRAGSFSEQFPLLFRDFLRAHGQAAAEYAAVKRDLAVRYAQQRHAYTDAKGPIVWDLIHRGDDWAQQTGWEPWPSDA